MAWAAPEQFSQLPPDEADLYGLVLASSRIPYTYRKRQGAWSILVRDRDVARARDAVAAYLAENTGTAEPPPYVPPFPRDYSGLAAAAVLFVFHAFVGPLSHADPWPMAEKGAAAARILDGELWRTVTALFLHADAAHLVANMAGIAVFGTLVAQMTGYGAAWVLILYTGAAGNLLNALFYQSHHLSVGASTAVFSALGLLGGIRAAAPWARRISRLARWVPIAGGLGLLAFLGTSVETDVTAHFFGFLSGCLAGAAYARLVRFPLGVWEQRTCLAFVALTVAASWALALT